MPNRFIRLYGRNRSLGQILLRGALSDFSVKTAGIILTLASQIILAKIMDAESFGNYMVVMAWVILLGLLARMGLDNTLLRFIAAYNSQQAFEKLMTIVGWSTRMVLLTGGFLGAGVALIALLFGNLFGKELVYTLCTAAVVIPLVALAQLRLFSLRALRCIFRAQLPELVLTPLIVTTAALALFAASIPVTSIKIMLVTLVAAMISVGLTTRWLNNRLPDATPVKITKELRTEWIHVALPLLLVSGMNVVILQADILMLGMLVNTTDAGAYAVISRIAALINFGLIAASSLAAPMISELHMHARTADLQRMITLVARGTIITVIPAVAIIVFWGEYLLSLLGASFSGGYSPLVILTFGNLFHALCGPVGILMTMTGNQRDAAAILAQSALLNIALNLLLIPFFGTQGAATATAASIAFWTVMMLTRVIARLQINPTVLPLKIPAR